MSPMILVFLLFNVANADTINTNVDYEYQDKIVNCTAAETCDITCDEYLSCNRAKLYSKRNYPFHISCAGVDSYMCGGALIDCSTSSYCNVQCGLTTSCQGAVILCPTSGDCDVSCDGTYTCLSTAIMWPTNKNSVNSLTCLSGSDVCTRTNQLPIFADDNNNDFYLNCTSSNTCEYSAILCPAAGGCHIQCDGATPCNGIIPYWTNNEYSISCTGNKCKSAGYLTCHSGVLCDSDVIICDPDQACTVDCNDPDGGNFVCYGTIINSLNAIGTTVYCNGESSCLAADVHCGAGICKVFCYSDASCTDLRLFCGTDVCNIRCDVANSCTYTRVYTHDVSLFICNAPDLSYCDHINIIPKPLIFSQSPTTTKPSLFPTTTGAPTTIQPTTHIPTSSPITSFPTTKFPITAIPTSIPTTQSPITNQPTSIPTFVPTSRPSTIQPTSIPTFKPITISPTANNPAIMETELISTDSNNEGKITETTMATEIGSSSDTKDNQSATTWIYIVIVIVILLMLLFIGWITGKKYIHAKTMQTRINIANTVIGETNDDNVTDNVRKTEKKEIITGINNNYDETDSDEDIYHKPIMSAVTTQGNINNIEIVQNELNEDLYSDNEDDRISSVVTPGITAGTIIEMIDITTPDGTYNDNNFIKEDAEDDDGELYEDDITTQSPTLTSK